MPIIRPDDLDQFRGARLEGINKDLLRPEAGKGDPVGAVVYRLSIGLTLRKVEFPVGGSLVNAP